jgi:hypothetical protein
MEKEESAASFFLSFTEYQLIDPALLTQESLNISENETRSGG